MKFVLATLIASASTATWDWSPCRKQDCSSTGWICCDITQSFSGADGFYYTEITGDMICADRTFRGIVPAAGGDYAGQAYHCAHKDLIDVDGGATGASEIPVLVYLLA